MAAPRVPTDAELRECWERSERRKEKNRLYQRASRARHADANRRQHDAVSMTPAPGAVSMTPVSTTPPLPPVSPREVPPSEVLPQTPSPTILLPIPLSPPLPPRSAETGANGITGRPRDPIWDALSDIFGEPSTVSERQARNAAAHDFREGARRAGFSPQEQAERILFAHENYAERMGPDTTETPFALAKHLSALVRPIAPRAPRLRQEVVQRVTQYAAQRVERNFTVLVDEHQRRDGG